jgi:hypothetical protein
VPWRRGRTITHTTVLIRGPLDRDVAVYHARTPDARVRINLGTTLMTLYSAQAAQGLLEAFAAYPHEALTQRRILPLCALFRSSVTTDRQPW